MLHMILAGCCLAIGFHIGKKIINQAEYHSYIQGEKIKEKYGPAIKEKTSWLKNAAKGALAYQLEQARKGRERWKQQHSK
jgi:hypothetical protein